MFHRFENHGILINFQKCVFGVNSIDFLGFHITAEVIVPMKTLTKAALLTHPDSNAQICLKVDASDLAIGAVVKQLQNSNWHPFAFFSRKLTNENGNIPYMSLR